MSTTAPPPVAPPAASTAPTPPVVNAAIRAALGARRPEHRPGALSHAVTFAWRALIKIRHAPEQLFDVVVTPVMFTLLFTYIFGGALEGSPRTYLQFLLPGVLVQTVTFTTIYTGFTLNTDLSKGIFDRFRSMPLWLPAPIVGAMLGDTIRYTISSIIVFVIGFVLGYRPEAGLGSIVAALALLNVYAFGIGWLFTTFALLVKTPSTVMTLSWLVLMPLTFASNIYVSPDTMPGWLQAFVGVNPVALVTTAIRQTLDGEATMAAIGWALLAPAVVTAICAPLAMALYRRER
ncbi:MAG TPA: ABC transporter permease [Rhodothermales bacterium]|nr:ABC transporter permease [Rhodothermales bacterium]